jgi:hypothetical protein
MTLEIPGAVWTEISSDAADERFVLDPEDFESLMLGEPDPPLVHDGSVVVDGDLVLDGEEARLHVIDGDLTVRGTLIFTTADVYTGLLVTGSVHAENVVCGWDAQFVVGASMHVKQLLVTGLTDAGCFIVKRSLSAHTWLEAGDRGTIEIGQQPRARLARTSDAISHYFGPDAEPERAEDVVLPDFFEDTWIEIERIQDALLAGKPVLR